MNKYSMLQLSILLYIGMRKDFFKNLASGCILDGGGRVAGWMLPVRQ